MKQRWASLSSMGVESSSGDEGEASLWVFGYGSLIWRPGFAYSESRRTRLAGFRRGFWQGNSTHRGTAERPGRVVTIAPCARSSVTGLAFRVEGAEAIADALAHLHQREVLAGYVFHSVELEDASEGPAAKPLQALTVIAQPSNPDWLGRDDPLHDVARQIAHARGPAGPNTDYLFELTKALREHFPAQQEDELFFIESHVRLLLQRTV